MKQETYERTELDIITFQTSDVIVTSNLHYELEEDELPLIGQ